MPTAWITYAWKDNKDKDVDFIAEELIQAGVNIKLDRWNIEAGKRLWEQIERFIADPKECDAWIMYATQNSLASEPCREELAIALDRALKTRGGSFPIIGLVPSHVESGLLPAAIRTRLYVDLSDPDWKDRIVSAVTGRERARKAGELTPYVETEYPPPAGFLFAVEVRPRAGVWHPFAVAIKKEEQDKVGLVVRDGPRGILPPPNSGHIGGGSGLSDDRQWFVTKGYNAATPTHSYYIFCKGIPSTIAFGQLGDSGQMYFRTST